MGMLTKQTIAIIGTGYEGKAIAARLASGNFYMLLCDKDIEKAESLVNELKGTVPSCNMEARQCSYESAWEADIIIFAMNFQEQMDLAEIIKEVVNQKILICTEQADMPIIAGVPSGASLAETIQKLLPNTKVVQFFNNDPGIHQSAFDKKDNSTLIAGKDDMAIETVSRIFESVGVECYQG